MPMDTFELLERLRVGLLQLHFDQGVLLRSDAFAALSIVVHARLVRLWGEDGVPLEG